MFPRLAHEGWKDCPAFDENVIRKISSYMIPNTYWPRPLKLAFNAFRMNPEDVKVVMIGLSPYYNMYAGKPNATGIAFAIPDEDRPFEGWPKSLQVLAEAVEFEYQEQLGGRPIEQYLTPDLGLWEGQGVLLLNASLTCLTREPTSHLHVWNEFMVKLIAWLQELKPGLVFWSLGNDAKKLLGDIFELSHFKYHSHHPSYYARKDTVMRDTHFKKIAQICEDRYGKPLHWILPF